LFLAILQIGIAIDPPVQQVVTLVVDQFDGAATTQQHSGGKHDTPRGMADNSLQDKDE
jgi:hypothetical protein